MEGANGTIDNEFERYAHQLERALPGVPFPVRLIGLKTALKGWGETWPQGTTTAQEVADRDRFFQQWSLETCQFFLDLQESSEVLACLLEIGEREIPGHSLRRLSPGYALYEDIRLFPSHKYKIDYANFHQVPQHSLSYDLPIGSYSPIEQLYVGDTRRQVALSLNQVRVSLMAGGDLMLLSRF